MDITYLVLEITRKCNLECDHCLRGDTETNTMSRETINNTLKQFQDGTISELTISGGEPMLCTRALQQIASALHKYDIHINTLFISTNGAIATHIFKESFKAIIDISTRFNSYLEEHEGLIFQLSNTIFHQEERARTDGETRYCENKTFLHALFGEKLRFNNNFSTHSREELSGLILSGRAADNFTNGRTITTDNYTLEYWDISDEGISNDDQLYITCNGDIILGCNWSYDMMDEVKIGSVNNEWTLPLLDEIKTGPQDSILQALYKQLDKEQSA